MATISFRVDDDGGHPFVGFRMRTFGFLTPSTQLVTVDGAPLVPRTVDAFPVQTADLRDAADFLNCSLDNYDYKCSWTCIIHCYRDCGDVI